MFKTDTFAEQYEELLKITQNYFIIFLICLFLT